MIIHRFDNPESPDRAEILPIVDKDDIVIGRERRDIVHQRGLRHRAIHALVFNYSGEMFLQKRGLHKDNDPGLWDSSVAGHVDYGESYDECCVREIAEEIGIHLAQAPKRLFKLEACRVTGMEFAWVYCLITGDVLEPNYQEMDRGEWCSVMVVNQLIKNQPYTVSSAFQKIWKHYCMEIDKL